MIQQLLMGLLIGGALKTAEANDRYHASFKTGAPYVHVPISQAVAASMFLDAVAEYAASR